MPSHGLCLALTTPRVGAAFFISKDEEQSMIFDKKMHDFHDVFSGFPSPSHIDPFSGITTCSSIGLYMSLTTDKAFWFAMLFRPSAKFRFLATFLCSQPNPSRIQVSLQCGLHKLQQRLKRPIALETAMAASHGKKMHQNRTIVPKPNEKRNFMLLA